MKRILPLLVALAAPSIAHAAPAPAVVAPAPVGIDPAAAAILDEAASAYAKLDGFSTHFNAYDQSGAKTTSMSGDLAFSRPGKARMDISASQLSLLMTTEGDKIFSEIKPKKLPANAKPPAKEYQSRYSEDGEPLQAVLQQIPSALSVTFPMLATGNNPLGMEEIKWLSANVLPDNGVRLTAALAPNVPPLVFRLYFDPQDKLLRRAEAEMSIKGQKTVNLTTLTNVQLNPEFPADKFTFTPEPGAKEIAQPPSFDPKLRVGAAPFALTGKDLQGKTHPWSQYAGKVVLLDFWATWCGPCMAEMPNILEKYSTYHASGFEILGVSLDEDKAALQGFLKQNKVAYPQIFDGKFWNTVDARTYGVMAIPFSLLIGKDGKIVAVNPRGRKLEPAIVKALAE